MGNGKRKGTSETEGASGGEGKGKGKNCTGARHTALRERLRLRLIRYVLKQKQDYY